MKRWPLNHSYFWERAPFFRILLPFVAGIYCYERGWLSAISGTTYLISLGSLLLAYVITAFAQKTKALSLQFVLLVTLLFIGGGGAAFFNDVRNEEQWFGHHVSGSDVWLARIEDEPREKEHSWKLTVSVIAQLNGNKTTATTGNAFIYAYKDQSPMLLHKGDTVLMPGKWAPIKNAGNPFEFDYARYCRDNNICYQQFCSAKDIRLYATNDPAHASATDRAHNWCMLQLDRYLTDHTAKGLMQAMLLGDEVNLDEDLRQSYSETGIVHIIAISGGNVAIFFIVISWLLWWLKDKKHQWIKLVLALPLVWFYVLMAGAAPSAIRAAIMFTLLTVGVTLQKNNNSLNQLFATAFVLLCAQPMWLFSVGFQLSFVAVLSLVLFYRPIHGWFAPKYKAARLLWNIVAASIAAEILVAPLVVYYFHTFPLLFVVANVAAYVFMGLTLILGIVIIALSWLPAVASLVGVITMALIKWFDTIVNYLQHFNPESFHFLLLTGAELLLLYVVIAGISYSLSKQHKPALFTGLVAACMLLVLLCGDEWGRLRQKRLVVYNTGKTSHVEYIGGTGFTIEHTDTVLRKKVAYATNGAHIAWGAWQQSAATQDELFSIAGKTVLLLKDKFAYTGVFPVDYVVVCNNCNDVAVLHKVFSPARIILSATLRKDKFNKMPGAYNTADSGAFIIQ